MEISRPEYWRGQLFPSPGDLPNPGIEPRSPALQADSLPAEPARKPVNTGVGSLSLLQGIFPAQEWNWGLLHCRWILYQLSCQGSPSLARGLLIFWCSQGTGFGCHFFPLFYCFLLHWFLLSSLLFPLFCISFGLFSSFLMWKLFFSLYCTF